MDWFSLLMLGTVPATLAIGWRYVSGEWIPPMLKRRLAIRSYRQVEPTYQDPNAFLDLYQWKRARREEDRADWECKHQQLLGNLPLSRSELAAHQARKAALKVLEPIAEKVTPTVYSFPVKPRSWHETEMAEAWSEYRRGLLNMKELKRRVKEIEHERLMHGQPGHRGW